MGQSPQIFTMHEKRVAFRNICILMSNSDFNPISQGVSIFSHADTHAPLEVKEGVALGPILLYISCKCLEFELTCKKLGKNLKK